MKFLLFNVVVAAALVYLFTGDRTDFHAAADGAWKATETVKKKARDVIGRADGGDETGAKSPTDDAKKPAGWAIAPLPAATADPEPAVVAESPAPVLTTPAPPGASVPETESSAPPAAPAVKTPETTPAAKPGLEPMKLTRPAKTRLAEASAPSAAPAPPSVPTDVAQRRAEVLGTAPVTRKPGFMSASDRRRDLMLLSEEMELFSAQAISR